MINSNQIKTRLEVNFLRLMKETEKIASGDKNKDWKFEKKMPKILILYGSQTGTAEEVAERIGRESVKYYFEPDILPMNDCSIDYLVGANIAVFVAATTGQGDDPENMKCFFQNLWKTRQNKHLLSDLHYAVLGLGDSSYQKFNFSAKRLNRLLGLLGARQLIGIGLADDQHDLGPDFVVDSWLKQLWQTSMDTFPLPDGIIPDLALSQPLPTFNVNYVDSKEDSDSPQFDPSSDFTLSKITLNSKRTSDDHFQDVRLVEFDVSNIDYSHQPGDVLMIQPRNLEEDVDLFFEILPLDPDKIISVVPPKNRKILGHLLTLPCTIRECARNYWDLKAIPKRYFFELLSYFTTDENEKEKFLEFASAEGQQELYSYCNRPRRTILEVLADFPHTNRNIPLEYLFDLIPVIKPRAYSIASSSKAIPVKAQILMSVVHYQTILKKPRLGLCSNWLVRLTLGSEVAISIKPGSLRFPDPSKPCHPVIMIGPGTGCAPFRSYIQERTYFGTHESLIMIFGCRGEYKDYFFREEWNQLQKENKLMLFTAFSRDQDDKVYVQHVMKQNYETLWKYIGDNNNNAQIYYAGNAKRIPIDVYEALLFICEKSLQVTKEEAERYMKTNIEKRYQTESWA